MTLNIPGIIAVAVCYVTICIIGIIAGKKSSKSKDNEAVLLADRSLGMVVSVFTLTATMVGGGYILGTAETTASSGVLQVQAPVGYCLSLIIAAFSFAPKMRREGYITMYDPFQLKYGKKAGALMVIPEMLGDLFWTAAVLAALGVTISIILDVNSALAIIISAASSVFYTSLGGLYSVAYTDVVQLCFIGIGLVIAAPFTLNAPAVDMSSIEGMWIGEVPIETIGSYIDIYLLCIMGGIPWQTIYQRSLACKTVYIAKMSTLMASFLSLVLAIPPIIMGVAASAADWNATSYHGPIPIPDNMKSYILPLALNYLTPQPVQIIALGAISAAVMSSADSTILSSSSVFTKNIYTDIIRPKASRRELSWVLRVSIIVTGTLATLIAIFSDSIYGLYILCSDLMYVVLFPQFLLVLYMTTSNAYGSLAGFAVTLTLRFLSGEPVLNLPPAIKFPFFDEDTQTQLFPFRTFTMLLGTMIIIIVSKATNVIFLKEFLPPKTDFLNCRQQKTIKMPLKMVQVPTDEDNDQDDTDYNAGTLL